MQILRHFQCSFYAILNVVFTPLPMHDLRLESLTRHSLNHRNTRLPGFWDAFSAPCLYRKMRPILNAHSGMQLPYTAPLGKRVPLWGWIPGRGFRLRADPETASHSGAEIWDAVSAVPGRKGKTHPIPSINSGARFVTSAHASRQTKSVWCLPCSPQPLGTLA